MSHEQHNHSLADFPHSYWRSYPIPHHPPMNPTKQPKSLLSAPESLGL